MLARKKVIWLSVLVAGGLGLSFVQQGLPLPQPTSAMVWNLGFEHWQAPPGATSQDFRDLLLAQANGAAPPAGFTHVESGGAVSCVLTSALKTDGSIRAVATVTDDVDDLAAAYVFVNGVQKASATYANGRLVDLGNGQAEATMNFWYPSPQVPSVAEVRWITLGGEVLSQEVSVSN